MSMRVRVATVVGLVLLVGGSLVACRAERRLASAEAPFTATVAEQIAADQCPAHRPTEVGGQRTALNHALVPVKARRLVVCRYAGMNTPQPLGLSATKAISDPRAVDSWRRRFNALPVVPPGTYDCPADDGSAILAGFVASGTSYTVVRVNLRGCAWATNGRVNRETYQPKDPNFRSELAGLVPG